MAGESTLGPGHAASEKARVEPRPILQPRLLLVPPALPPSADTTGAAKPGLG